MRQLVHGKPDTKVEDRQKPRDIHDSRGKQGQPDLRDFSVHEEVPRRACVTCSLVPFLLGAPACPSPSKALAPPVTK